MNEIKFLNIWDNKESVNFIRENPTVFPFTLDPQLGEHNLSDDPNTAATKGYAYYENEDGDQSITICSRLGIFNLINDLAKNITDLLETPHTPGDDESNDIMAITDLMRALSYFDTDAADHSMQYNS